MEPKHEQPHDTQHKNTQGCYTLNILSYPNSHCPIAALLGHWMLLIFYLLTTSSIISFECSYYFIQEAILWAMATTGS